MDVDTDRPPDAGLSPLELLLRDALRDAEIPLGSPPVAHPRGA